MKPSKIEKFQYSNIPCSNQDPHHNLNSQKTSIQIPFFTDLYKEFVNDVEQNKQDADQLIKKRTKSKKILNLKKTQCFQKKVLIVAIILLYCML